MLKAKDAGGKKVPKYFNQTKSIFSYLGINMISKFIAIWSFYQFYAKERYSYLDKYFNI